MSDDPRSRLRENATEVASTIVTGIWLALLLSGVGGQLWLAALLVGYVVVVPLVALLYGDEEDRREWWDDEDWLDGDWLDGWFGESDDADDVSSDSPKPSNRDALETLRERYAAGELTDEQFEHKLERLLGVETLEDAEEWRRDARERGTRDRPRDAGHDGSRERNPEYET